MLKLSISVVLAAGLSLGAAAVMAADRDAPRSARTNEAPPLDAMSMKRMDTNKDGLISRAEFLARIADEALWIARDSNGDGVLEAREQRDALVLAPRTRH